MPCVVQHKLYGLSGSYGSMHASPRRRKGKLLSDETTCSCCPCHSSNVPINACKPLKADICGIAVTMRDPLRRFSGAPLLWKSHLLEKPSYFVRKS